ncbi:hypothetical protein [Sphingomonas sp.]|uniref:hypothetical protein n=1 Tax=Sphingomonas sp. TaxID=28214 RepID=UPI001ECC1A29|nr:hypothetical protein [Sphingomonas sp.]MBX3593732.1 hypothetical protein [Sphingomonas sp.]
MERDDIAYFTRRERDERAHAERAAEGTARRVHRELANRYAERLRDLTPNMPDPA